MRLFTPVNVQRLYGNLEIIRTRRKLEKDNIGAIVFRQQQSMFSLIGRYSDFPAPTVTKEFQPNGFRSAQQNQRITERAGS